MPATEQIINVSGYRFIELEEHEELPALRDAMLEAFNEIGVKGTILIAQEGINAAFAGTSDQITRVRAWFANDARFASLWLKESPSQILPFSKLKVKIRPEIITFEPNLTHAQRISPTDTPAPVIAPKKLKEWLDSKRDFTLLDTRNTYEIDSGTFEKAVDLNIDIFKNFTKAVDDAVANGTLNTDEPVVTFCTGGIRCEKAAPYLLQNGFKEVYQIEGGILNYFEQCGGEHWDGNCFVFDDRAEINPELEPTGATLCHECHRAVPAEQICPCDKPPPR